jgi:hypothetical protein
MTLREGGAMNETVRAVAIATEDEAIAWIATALDEVDFAKEAETYRLAKRFELDLEPIASVWDEERAEAKARLALDRARLTDLSARLTKLKPKTQAATGADKEQIGPSASTAVSFRRNFAAAHERLAKKEEALFISPEIQPM